jgi:hypothetical protein
VQSNNVQFLLRYERTMMHGPMAMTTKSIKKKVSKLPILILIPLSQKLLCIPT